MKISVIGCGYLGTVHAAALAHLGHTVVGIDVDVPRIEQLRSGITPFYEPGLDELLTEGLSNGRLTFDTQFEAAASAEVHFITVGTPQLAGDNRADMSYIDSAIQSLLPHLREGALVVGKSTVPLGTAARVRDIVTASEPSAELLWNPEFLREGFAIQDTLHPDRMVYGAPDEETATAAVQKLDQVYADLLQQFVPKIVTNYATAELVKVAANAFLATKISFINAMAEVSEASGADVTQLADALGHDARIGRKFLNAGLGFGGGCLPKDIRAFAARAEEIGVGNSLEFLHQMDEINTRRRTYVVGQVVQATGGAIAGARVTMLGCTFKPHSDDVRDSPALDVAVQLHDLGAQVTITDPKGIPNAIRKYPFLVGTPDTKYALDNAAVVVLATEWPEYSGLNAQETREMVTSTVTPTMIDARNVLDPNEWRAAGWNYVGLGR